jgi:hypothetical protein
MKRITGLLAALAALILFTGVAWADKSYRIQFSQPVTLAGTEVAAGEYDIVIDQENVRLRDVDTGRAVDLKPQIVAVDRKYEHTAVLSNRAGGNVEVTEIQLGGAKVRLVFKGAVTPNT